MSSPSRRLVASFRALERNECKVCRMRTWHQLQAFPPSTAAERFPALNTSCAFSALSVSAKFPRSALVVSSKVVCRFARWLFVIYVCYYLNVLITLTSLSTWSRQSWNLCPHSRYKVLLFLTSTVNRPWCTAVNSRGSIVSSPGNPGGGVLESFSSNVCGAAKETHQNNNSVNLKINENLTTKKVEAGTPTKRQVYKQGLFSNYRDISGKFHWNRNGTLRSTWKFSEIILPLRHYRGSSLTSWSGPT